MRRSLACLAILVASSCAAVTPRSSPTPEITSSAVTLPTASVTASPAVTLPTASVTASPAAVPSSAAPSAEPTASAPPTPSGAAPVPSSTASPSTSILSTTETAGLAAALDLERYSYASYAQVIQDFGDVRPFVNVLPAEQTHVNEIKALFTRYSVTIPDEGVEAVDRYATLSTACVAAATNEQHVVTAYGQLLLTTSRADILNVYRTLLAVSRDNHLVAFTRC